MARAVRQIVFPGALLAEETYELVRSHNEPTKARPGHVVVKLTVRPVHPIDLAIIKSGELSRYKDEGVVLGSEGVGFVACIGEGVTGFRLGDRVVPILFWKYFRNGIGGHGSWQDFVEVRGEDLVLVPDSVPDEVAAQYVINPWTAYGLLVDVNVPKGECLLISGASSMIGRQIIEISRHWGILPIAIVRRGGLKEELKSIGASHVINSSSEDIVAIVSWITGGKGAYAAVDSVGGLVTKSLGSSVRDGGKVFAFGSLGSQDITFSSLDLKRDVQVSWWYLTRYLEASTANYERTKTEVMKLLESQVLKPLVGKKFHLQDFRIAIEESDRNFRDGKVLLID